MSGAPLHADVRFWRDEDLPGVEARFSSYSQKAFRTHTHRHYLVSLVEAGSTRFSLDRALHNARAGQIVVIEAGRPHACNPAPGSGIAYRLLALDTGWLAGAFRGADEDETPRFAAPVLDDPELFAVWRELHEAFVRSAPTDEKLALLLACLRGLVDRHAVAATPEPQSPAVDRVRQHLAASTGTWVPLDELARLAGLSRHHFLRVFKAATGLPPHAYQMQQAVEHAKALLAEGMPISQAALDAGFADQSHFSRCFREFTGATPRQYLASRPGNARPEDLPPRRA
jgi:AraC-like DNA-binding protein